MGTKVSLSLSPPGAKADGAGIWPLTSI